MVGRYEFGQYPRIETIATFRAGTDKDLDILAILEIHSRLRVS